MPIIVSSGVVFTEAETEDHPLIAYDNIVNVDNVAADTEEANHPASELANPATNLYWLGEDTSQQYLTVTTDGVTPVEYIALVGHNLGTIQSAVSIEGLIGSPPAWTALESPVTLDDDTPVMWRITPQVLPQFRIRMQSGSAEPRASVLMAGELLVMERKLYSGHVPISHGRKLVVSNGRSESGDFLGRIVTGEDRETTAAFRLLTPAWVRANFLAFLLVAKDLPFMFVWRPGSYPDDVGYCWLVNDPQPMNGQPSDNNLISVDLQLGAVA